MLQSKLDTATKELTSVQEQNKLILEDNMLMKEKLNRLEGQMLEMQGSGVRESSINVIFIFKSVLILYVWSLIRWEEEDLK